MYCCVCGSKLRSEKHLDFLGSVCSICFRMSKKKYCILVDTMAYEKINFILKEVDKIKKQFHSR